jgi:DUF2911 family protein
MRALPSEARNAPARATPGAFSMKTSLAFLLGGLLLGVAAIYPAAPARTAGLDGAARAAQASDGKPYVQDEPRGMARVVYFGGNGVAAEYTVEYGKPAWKDEFEKQLKGRLRLGSNYWTTLDTWNGLSIGEKDVKAGEYFVALECSEKNQWSLVLLDPEPLRKSKIDGYSSNQTRGGQLVPMQHAETKESAETLAIRFIADEKDARLQTLEIRFGKHRLSAAVKPKA